MTLRDLLLNPILEMAAQNVHGLFQKHWKRPVKPMVGGLQWLEARISP